MKVWLKALVACAVVLTASVLGVANDKSDDKKPESKSVNIKSISFDPKKLEILVGESVVWTNKSRTKHTATSEDDGKTFDTGDVEPNKSSKAIKFGKEGEFKYHCKVHGQTMSGTIVVKAEKKK